jgi:signal transduction histidine kinase
MVGRSDPLNQTVIAFTERASRSPIRFLTIAFLVTAIVISLSVWSAYDSYQKFDAVLDNGLRFQELRSQILRYDEILTMSARMAAATGDARWEARYREFEPELGRVIDEARALVSDLTTTAQTDTANDALVALEEQAFELVRERRLAEAQALLTGEDYARHKTVYAAGIEKLDRQLDNIANTATQSLQERSALQLAGGLIVLPLLIGGWLLVLRITDRWRQDIAERNELLLQLNRDLDQKVRERTMELERATEKARAANAAKSTFLLNMSHELRTPMNAILGYSEMLIEEAEELEPKYFIPELQKINDAGKHLLALIDDVLDLSKVETGRMDLCPETFEIVPLVQTIVSTVQPLVAKNANELVVQCEDDLGEMHADVTKLRQSLVNLLSNAAKFTEHGMLTLTVTRDVENDRVRFDVSDTGIGIPPGRLESVFDEFTQVDESTTRVYGGTGLGLAISRRFCRMMGGDISVVSKTGVGSAFSIVLPARIADKAVTTGWPKRSAPPS